MVRSVGGTTDVVKVRRKIPGWRIVCSACGRQSGVYGDEVTAEEDAQGHREHRCPGPWLLEPDDDRVYVSLLPERPKPAWMRRNSGF